MLITLLLLGGFAVLVLGAEVLVRGASRLAAGWGLSPLVIGLTIVAFGTSAPELAVSVQAGAVGDGAIAVGNVVGSNIFNVLLILGVSALVTPLLVQLRILKQDVPVMVGVSLLVPLLAWDGVIDSIDGVLLTLGIFAYTGWLVVQSKRENTDAQTPAVPVGRAWANLVLVIVGVLLLVLGARWLVDGAVRLAEVIGVDKRIVGVTVVAAGTSLPELATSVLAAIRGQREIAVGNIVGSNVFNLLGILGVSAMFAPGGLAFAGQTLWVDTPVMILAALACLPICFTGSRISRAEGGLLLSGYLAYVSWLVFSVLSGSGD